MPGPRAELSVVMQRDNPEPLLRNDLAQIAIGHANRAEDYTGIGRLFKLLQDPLAGQPGTERQPNQRRARQGLFRQAVFMAKRDTE